MFKILLLRSFEIPKDGVVVESVEQSIENTIPTVDVRRGKVLFHPTDKFEDLQNAIKKLKADEEKSSKQSSSEVDTFPSMGEILHMHPRYVNNFVLPSYN